MKHVTITGVFLILVVVAAAQMDSIEFKQRQQLHSLDVMHLKSYEYKKSTGRLIKMYGFNDTAAAVIKMYMAKKGANLGGFIGMQLGASVASLLTNTTANTTTNIDNNSFNQQQDVNAAAILVPMAFTGVSVYFLVKTIGWSRRKLIRTLWKYEATGELPKKVIKKLKPEHFKK